MERGSARGLPCQGGAEGPPSSTVRAWLSVLLAAVTALVVPGWWCPPPGATRCVDAIETGEELRRPEPPDRPVAKPPAPAGVVAVKERQPELSTPDAELRAVLVATVTLHGVAAEGCEAPAPLWAPWSLTVWRRAGHRARAPPV